MVSAVVSIQTWLAARRPDGASERGASLVEYALLVALIALICIAAVGFLGDETASQFTETGDSFADINAN